MEFFNLSSLYRLFNSLYSHMYRAYRGNKWETELGYRETWYSTTATLVLLRAPSTAPIQETDEYDGYIQWKNEWYVGASSGIRTRVFDLKGETCNRSATATPSCIEERKESQKSDIGRHGIPAQSRRFFCVPGVKLRYTGSPFYVPIRRTMMNTMDIYNEQTDDMWEQAPGNRTRAFRLKAETCNRSTTAAPYFYWKVNSFTCPSPSQYKYN